MQEKDTAFDATPTRINLTPPPDLEVDLVDVPTQVRAGESLTINYRTTNFGSTATPNSSWQDSFYLSVDNQFDPNTDLFLGSRTRSGALNVDESFDTLPIYNREIHSVALLRGLFS